MGFTAGGFGGGFGALGNVMGNMNMGAMAQKQAQAQLEAQKIQNQISQQQVTNAPLETQIKQKELESTSLDVEAKKTAQSNNFTSKAFPWASAVDPKLTFSNDKKGHNEDFTAALAAAYPQDAIAIEHLYQDYSNPQTRSKAQADLATVQKQDPMRGARLSYWLAAKTGTRDQLLQDYTTQANNIRTNATRSSVAQAQIASREKYKDAELQLKRDLGDQKFGMFMINQKRLGDDFSQKMALEGDKFDFNKWLGQAKLNVDYKKLDQKGQQLLEQEWKDAYTMILKQDAIGAQYPNSPTININVGAGGGQPTITGGGGQGGGQGGGGTGGGAPTYPGRPIRPTELAAVKKQLGGIKDKTAKKAAQARVRAYLESQGIKAPPNLDSF